jgi:DNA-binding beta-propeller fold protein YncE
VDVKRLTYLRFVPFMLIIALAAALPSHDLFSADRAPAFERAKEDFQKGFVWFNSMNYLAAAEYFRRALTSYPEYHTAREYLARSYRLAGYSDEARREWELLSKESDSPLIKAKIDSINFRETKLSTRDDREFVESRRILSSEMGRYKFDSPVDIASDNAQNLFVTSFTTGRLIKLSINGEPVDYRSFDLSSKPWGIDCRNDRIVMTDFGGDKVYILNTDMKTLASFGKRGTAAGMFHGPEGVCFDDRGYIYVADSGNNRIQKFSPSGEFVLSFGKEGHYEGELISPADCAADNGKVFVLDSGNLRVAIFDDSGNFTENINSIGLSSPRGITIKGRTLVISDEKSGVCFYNLDSKEKSFFKEWDDGKSGLSRATSAVYDREGFFYIVDLSRQAIFVMTPLSLRYTNLDVEIQSVDTKKYPLVAFYLSVRDRSGRPLYGLESSNFEIIEDGARIRNPYVDYFKDRNQSISAALVVDRSSVAGKSSDKVSWAADFFLKKMKKNDAAKIINYNSDSFTSMNFDWSRLRALKVLSEGKYGAGKVTGKALYGAIGDLAPRQNRRAVILFTDGTSDQSSFRQYRPNQIIDYAREHFIKIFVVSFKDSDEQLQKIASDTGGAFVRASNIDFMNTLYDRIRSSEENRYAVVYNSFKTEEFTDWWSDVSIRINLKGVIGAEWSGYFVPRIKGLPRRSAGKMPTSSGAAPNKQEGSGPPPPAAGGEGHH